MQAAVLGDQGVLRTLDFRHPEVQFRREVLDVVRQGPVRRIRRRHPDHPEPIVVVSATVNVAVELHDGVLEVGRQGVVLGRQDVLEVTFEHRQPIGHGRPLGIRMNDVVFDQGNGALEVSYGGVEVRHVPVEQNLPVLQENHPAGDGVVEFVEASLQADRPHVYLVDPVEQGLVQVSFPDLALEVLQNRVDDLLDVDVATGSSSDDFTTTLSVVDVGSGGGRLDRVEDFLDTVEQLCRVLVERRLGKQGGVLEVDESTVHGGPPSHDQFIAVFEGSG